MVITGPPHIPGPTSHLAAMESGGIGRSDDCGNRTIRKCVAAVEIAECSDEVAFRTSGKHATPAAQTGLTDFQPDIVIFALSGKRHDGIRRSEYFR